MFHFECCQRGIFLVELGFSIRQLLREERCRILGVLLAYGKTLLDKHRSDRGAHLLGVSGTVERHVDEKARQMGGLSFFHRSYGSDLDRFLQSPNEIVDWNSIDILGIQS